MEIDAHRTAGHELEAPAAADTAEVDNAGRRGELSARLAAATKMLADAASVEPATITIGRALLFLTEAERAAIFLRSPNGLVTCPWSHNLSDAYVQDIVTPKDANPWMHILRHPELSCMDLPKTKLRASAAPWLLPDALALSSDHAHLVERITREGVRSMCASPLTHSGRVTGAFVYCYDSPHVYSQDEQDVIIAFGSQAAAALRAPGAPFSQAQSAMNGRDTTRTPTGSGAAFGVKTADSAPKQQSIDATRPALADTHRMTERLAEARPELDMTQALAPKTGAQEAGTLQELSPMWNAAATADPESRERSEALGQSRWRQATLIASIVIAAVATVTALGIRPAPQGRPVSTMEQKPAVQVSATAVQKRPVPTPHRAIAASVVASVAKAGAPPANSRPLRPRKAAYIVVVGTFENANAAEEMKRLVQSKGYVVHVMVQGTVSKVVTAPMRTRAQAEGVARGLGAVGLQPQLVPWQEQ